MKKNTLQISLSLIIICIGALGAWYYLNTTVTSMPKDQKEREWTVQAERIKPGDFSPTIKLYGTVEAPDKATIRSEVSANIHNVLIKEGQKIHRGELLVLLEQHDYTLILKQRQAELKMVNADLWSLAAQYAANIKALKQEKIILALEQQALARLEKVFKDKHISKDMIDKARQSLAKTKLAVVLRQKAVDDHNSQQAKLMAQREQKNALLNKAQLDLVRTKIISPFAGTIGKVFVSKGDQASVGSAMLSIKPANQEEVRLQTPPSIQDILIQALRDKQPILGKVITHGKPITLRLDRLAPSIDKGKIGTEALFITEEKAAFLQEGSVISVRVTLPKINGVYAAPIQALYGNNTLYQIEKGRLNAVSIKRLGDMTNDQGKHLMLFKSKALKLNNYILISQLPNAAPGIKVNVAHTKDTANDRPTQ